MKNQHFWKIGFIILLVWISACSPASSPAMSENQTESPVTSPSKENSIETKVGEEPSNEDSQELEGQQGGLPEAPPEELIPTPTAAMTPAPTNSPENDEFEPSSELTVRTWQEDRLVEFEYPVRMNYGDSDVVRLSLIPIANGYVVQSEFPDHQIKTNPIEIQRPEGYELWGIAWIDGVGFEIKSASQEKLIGINEESTWRWSLTPKSSGTHRLTITLKFRWESVEENIGGHTFESEVFSSAFEVTVKSIFGLNRNQSLVGGFGGLILSSTLGLAALFWRSKPYKLLLDEKQPDPELAIESKPTIILKDIELKMIRALFNGYGRLLVESEFLSGYSGARTLLVLPVHPNQRYDAELIIKIGTKKNITREYENYLKYVKHTLPPMTARIQKPPVTIARSDMAAIQYTFIAEPGKPPRSLRQVLLGNEDLEIILRLFDSFGPNWWYQKRPYVYRLDQELDRKLPSHLYIRPLSRNQKAEKYVIDENSRIENLKLDIGTCFQLGKFSDIDKRSDGKTFTLTGKTFSDSPPIRLRWSSPDLPKPCAVEVIATRSSLYRDWIKKIDIYDYPDPYDFLQTIIYETIEGSQSIIHGDLNLENVLIGPGGFVWLIDFAETRLGPPVQDIAHLYVEIISHIILDKEISRKVFIELVQNDDHPLLKLMLQIANQCVKTGTNLREYRISLLVALLGALKYENLSTQKRQNLYLAAAIQSKIIKNL